MTVGYVYAIDGGDAVKIGWSGDPRRRFTKVSSDNPAATHIIGFISATLDQEKALHDLLAPWRIRREWYRNEGAVTAFIEMLPPLLASSKRVGGRSHHPLCRWRKARGIGQSAFAKTVGVTQGRVSQIEAGRWAPSLNLAIQIVDATNHEVTADELLPASSRAEDAA